MRENSTRKGLAAIYRQEIIQDVTLFTSQSAAVFYDKLFTELDFTLPRAATGRRGFPKEPMVCAFIVMKCEGFSLITDLADYLDNNRLIAHYCGFNIMKPLPSCLHEPTPDEVLEIKERFCRLWNALNSLPEIQGRRIDACIILGKSVKEVACAEGVHEESVRQSIKRGLERMKKLFNFFDFPTWK